MSDHVPVGIAQVSQRFGLAGKFLHTVFTKQPNPGFISLANSFNQMSLGYRHQRDFVGVASATTRGSVNKLMNERDVFGDGHEKENAEVEIRIKKSCSGFCILTSDFC